MTHPGLDILRLFRLLADGELHVLPSAHFFGMRALHGHRFDSTLEYSSDGHLGLLRLVPTPPSTFSQGTPRPFVVCNVKFPCAGNRIQHS